MSRMPIPYVFRSVQVPWPLPPRVTSNWWWRAKSRKDLEVSVLWLGVKHSNPSI